MAKDGTNRSGRRVRACDKPASLADKFTAGTATKVLETPDLKSVTMLTEAYSKQLYHSNWYGCAENQHIRTSLNDRDLPCRSTSSHPDIFVQNVHKKIDILVMIGCIHAGLPPLAH